MAATFQEATSVSRINSHTYAANFNTEWCVGSVPHGGVVTSVFLRVAAVHFQSTLAAQNQPHTITLHVEFLRRTQEGPATLTVRDVKLGRQASTIHITLSQDGREEVVGYLTHSNLETEAGLSLKTRWSLHPPPPSTPVDFGALIAGEDPHWVELTDKPFPKFRKVTHRARTFLPREGQRVPGIVDEWLRLDSGEPFTNESVGFASDFFSSVVADLWRKENVNIPIPAFWFPTLLLNIDFKKSLPPQGVDWLFVRVQTKSVKNGRMDLDVVILDEVGEIVALSHHVALIVGAERNLAARRNGETKI
ncbi:hypothetical protein M426DRAFT_326309 [Hypoxylon sp. CI-4A]|nr:hypothetical protein M426DRAFT_326309 [Hypoxylon sp. CI-4A]